jgi:hypothetical protein
MKFESFFHVEPRSRGRGVNFGFVAGPLPLGGPRSRAYVEIDLRNTVSVVKTDVYGL